MYKFNKDIYLNDYLRVWGEFQNILIYSDPHFSDLNCYKQRVPEAFIKHKIIIDDVVYDIELDSYTDEAIVEWLDNWQVNNINSMAHQKDVLIMLGDICNTEYVKKLKAGYKVLVMGNHDSGETNYKDLFNEVYKGILPLNDRVIASHEPLDFPFPVYNIHGHDHVNGYKKDGKHKNYCAEVIGFKPQRFSDLIKSGALKNIENYHRVTIDKATERKLKRRK